MLPTGPAHVGAAPRPDPAIRRPTGGLDHDRIRAALGGPELGWLIERVRTRIQRGRPLTGVITRAPASPDERAAVARLLGRRAGRGEALAVRLEDLDEEIRDAGIAPDLRAAVEVLAGPLRDLAGEQADEQARVAAALAMLRAGSHAGADWYAAWIDGLVDDGTLTRLARRGDTALAGQSAAVLGRLPADGMLAVPVLAERAVGDTKALAGTPLARLVLRALAIRAGQPPARDRGQERQLWQSAGVVVDDLSSQVLVLNVTARENHMVSGWLRDATEGGIPFRLTLHQLTGDPLTPTGPQLFVCENPAVLRTAAGELADTCAPLICTEGVPSAACLRLLRAAAGAGVSIRWRADLDWTGLRTTGDGIGRFGAAAWRMGSGDYLAAVERGQSEPLRGAPAASPWDPPLAGHLSRVGRAVMEERLLPELLADLAG
jgi:uncharacterized protein (TIGR02679 family)